MTDSSPHEQTANSAPSTLTTSPSSAALKALPRPISIRHSQSYEPAPPSPTDQNPISELRGARSSASLNLLASSNSLFQQKSPRGLGQRTQISPLRTSPFSNPFKKLQNTFNNTGKKSLDLSNSNNNNDMGSFVSGRPERVVSSPSSANSLTSWRSKGAEILSKSWGRNRKNSEPLKKNDSESMSMIPIFGADLEDAIRISHIPNAPLIPAVLYRCAEFLEAKGVDEVGLYRVPGSHANVQKLKRIFDTGKDYNLMKMDGIDPNDIATLLKLYLRELPNPLMPPVLLEQFQSLLSTDRQICHILRSILVRLPPHNYVVLSFLCHHLSKIASHAEKTKMTVSNLGVVFAPTLAIGSVLFKALLGGFYDGTNTSENRENGLEIIWGGITEHCRDNIQENLEDESMEMTSGQGTNDKQEYNDSGSDRDADRDIQDNSFNMDQGQNQPQLSYRESSQTSIGHQNMPTMSPLNGHYAGGEGSYFPLVFQQGIGPIDPIDQPSSERISEDPFSSTTPGSISLEEVAENEEAILMKAMLEREEVATKPPPLSSSSVPGLTQGPSSCEALAINAPTPSSHLTSAATITDNLNTTSTASGISSKTSKITETSILPSLMPIPSSPQSASASHITINAGTEVSIHFSTLTNGINNEPQTRGPSGNSGLEKFLAPNGTAESQIQTVDPPLKS
ncbi:hypothetical protein BGX27_001979 [Mortierella sp. AM989]|nr:hypothetical protein BGX27_001979 [Mortierella sp. AM989]